MKRARAYARAVFVRFYQYAAPAAALASCSRSFLLLIVSENIKCVSPVNPQEMGYDRYTIHSSFTAGQTV